jgi:hypothetical protein
MKGLPMGLTKETMEVSEAICGVINSIHHNLLYEPHSGVMTEMLSALGDYVTSEDWSQAPKLVCKLRKLAAEIESRVMSDILFQMGGEE